MENPIAVYEKSAELGNSKAMMALGRINDQGLGTKPDLMKAYIYYDMASEKGESYADFCLGKECEVKLQIN